MQVLYFTNIIPTDRFGLFFVLKSSLFGFIVQINNKFI